MEGQILMMGKPVSIIGTEHTSSIAVPLALDQSGRMLSKMVVEDNDNFENIKSVTGTAPNNDGFATTYIGMNTLALGMLFNGTSVDRERANVEETILASAVRAVDTNSADFTNFNNRGIHVAVDVTIITGAGVIPTLQGKDAVSGKYYDLLIGPTITTVGTTVLKLYPGIGVVANGSASDILPRTYRIKMDHQDSADLTYSVGGNLVR